MFEIMFAHESLQRWFKFSKIPKKGLYWALKDEVLEKYQGHQGISGSNCMIIMNRNQIYTKYFIKYLNRHLSMKLTKKWIKDRDTKSKYQEMHTLCRAFQHFKPLFALFNGSETLKLNTWNLVLLCSMDLNHSAHLLKIVKDESKCLQDRWNYWWCGM